MTRKGFAMLAVVLGVVVTVAAVQGADQPTLTSPPGTPQRILNPPQRAPFLPPGSHMGVPPQPPEDEDREHGHRRDHRFFFFVWPYYYYNPADLYSNPYAGSTYYYSPYLYYNYYGYPPYYYAPSVPGNQGYATPQATPQERKPAETAPSKEAAPAAEERVFESQFSPMLGEPTLVGAGFALGEAKLKTGAFSDSITAFQEARKGAPADAAPHIALALSLEGAQRYEGAAYMLRKGLTAIRDWNAVHLALAQAFGGPDRYSAVASQLMEAYRKDSGSRDLQLLVGFHYFGTGQYAKAAGILLPLQKAVPEDEAVMALLRAAENRLGAEGAGGPAAGGPAMAGGGAGQPPGGVSKPPTVPEHPGPSK